MSNDPLQLFAMQFLQSIIEIAVPVLAAAAVALLYQAARFVRSKLKAEQLAYIDALVAVAVKAAEQSGLIGAISNVASDKKAWAVGEAQRLLDERGLRGISVETLETMVEAAIRDGVHKGTPQVVANKAAPPVAVVSQWDASALTSTLGVTTTTSAFPPPVTPTSANSGTAARYEPPGRR